MTHNASRTTATTSTEQRTVLITGVSSGLGRAMAHEALQRGDVVVGTVRREEDLRSFEATAPGRAIGRIFDVSDTAGAAGLVRSVEAQVGHVDVLINNAGYGLAGVVEELDLDALRAEFDVDVIGQVAMVQAVLPGMRSRGRGHILNIVSMGGIVTFPANGAYHAAKFAMLGLSDSLAQEVGPLGVRVTSILPGMYNTDWIGRSRAQTVQSIADYQPLYASMEAPSMSGDPARLAVVVLDLLDVEEPPVRLLVGHTAVQMVREAMAQQADELDRWETVSDTDGDG